MDALHLASQFAALVARDSSRCWSALPSCSSLTDCAVLAASSRSRCSPCCSSWERRSAWATDGARRWTLSLTRFMWPRCCRSAAWRSAPRRCMPEESSSSAARSAFRAKASSMPGAQARSSAASTACRRSPSRSSRSCSVQRALTASRSSRWSLLCSSSWSTGAQGRSCGTGRARSGLGRARNGLGRESRLSHRSRCRSCASSWGDTDLLAGAADRLT
mmetsp:Transcript_48124/g.137464  ORF Transcript_48124/g.137464 Transcript_48124/m.137464 type:complete len:218 (-) Transcript_48124:184-837(-)